MSAWCKSSVDVSLGCSGASQTQVISALCQKLSCERAATSLARSAAVACKTAKAKGAARATANVDATAADSSVSPN